MKATTMIPFVLCALVLGTCRGAPTADVLWTRPLLKGYDRYIGWPTACRTSKGEILAVFSGDRDAHVCPHGKVQLTRSTDNGETWSKAETARSTTATPASSN